MNLQKAFIYQPYQTFSMNFDSFIFSLVAFPANSLNSVECSALSYSRGKLIHLIRICVTLLLYSYYRALSTPGMCKCVFNIIILVRSVSSPGSHMPTTVAMMSKMTNDIFPSTSTITPVTLYSIKCHLWFIEVDMWRYAVTLKWNSCVRKTKSSLLR